MRPLELDRQADVLFDGLKVNSQVRIEFLTISVRKNSGIDLKASFDALCTRIAGRNYKKIIAWAGVWVDNPSEHAHLLWRKPYVRYDRLNAMWYDITKGQGTGIVSSTVKGDKSKRNDVRRLVYYIIEQDHNDLEKGHLPITFSHSYNWFKKPKLSKKQSIKQSEKQTVLPGEDYG